MTKKKTMITAASLIIRINQNQELEITSEHPITILEDYRSWQHLNDAVNHCIERKTIKADSIRFIVKHRGHTYDRQPINIPLIDPKYTVLYFADMDEFMVIKNDAWRFIHNRLSEILEAHLWEHRKSLRIKQSLEALIQKRKNLKK